MEAADFARMLHSLGASHQTRRAALRRLGLGGVAAGLLTAADVRSGRAQTWEEATPSPGQAETAPANTPFAGVTGGLPPFGYPLAESIPVHYEAGSVQWPPATSVRPYAGSPWRRSALPLAACVSCTGT